MKFYKSNFFLIITSFLVSLTFLEILFAYTIPKPYKHEFFFERYYLYDQGKIFKNVNNFFKFNPNSLIRQDAYYFIKNKFVKEFTYNIKTNNFGLVQGTDIKKNTQSILFLGDSLTEGLGASSWTDKFSNEINKYQVINAGIRGTSATQSELLEKHISDNFDVKKIVFIYQGGFINRDLYQFSNEGLLCLENYKTCTGNRFNFGFPLNEKDPNDFLVKMKSERDKIIKDEQKKTSWKKTRRKIKKKISELHIINIPRTFVQKKFYKSKNEKIIKNFKAIERLIKKYDKNIIFIRLNSYTEIIRGKDYYSMHTDKYIKSLTDKHFYCNLENNLENFYVYDLHPNEKGYQQVYNCVKNIVDKNLF